MDATGSAIAHRVIDQTSGVLTFRNRLDHILARLGVRRSRHRVQPGLYALGNPSDSSPVFVSANYTLSFDALRSAARGIDAFILVLDTNGVNVWCAAGKGTFGTNEIVKKVEETALADMVSHRTLIVPQLGAPGVAAHEVKRRSGFTVKYGPVRAEDLPDYLSSGNATQQMRSVGFPTAARSVLIPVEAVHILLPVLLVNVVLTVTGVIDHFYNEVFAGILAGTVLFPLLLPWIPTKDFSSKGLLVGAAVVAPIIIRDVIGSQGTAWYVLAGSALGSLLIVSAVSAFLALNFTGSSTFTSKTGVQKEMYRYIPVMAWSFGIGLVLTITMLILG